MVMKQVYMVIGCPGSGKSWICEQLREQFHYVRHDDTMGGSAYVDDIVRQARTANRPLLIETPFSISQLKDPLELAGFRVTPVFIREEPETIAARYRNREGKIIPSGHLSRQKTYAERAAKWQAYQGKSAEVLAYLKNAVPQPKEKWPWEQTG